ncbi:MAG TPA: sugar ABC transporter permease [Mycobacteriales bacterium]|nr:sugar ABC transporter permease [Mycobacteriales bacterium]
MSKSEALSGRLTFRARNTITAYIFTLPMIVGVGIFTIYPLISSLYHSFTDWSGVSKAKWVGLENFRYLLTQDPTFWPSLKVTVYYMALSVPAGMIAGLALAVLLNRAFTGVRIFRTIFYLPVVLPSIAVLTLWKYIYDPSYGLANEILGDLHLPTSQWLAGSNSAMPSIVIVGLWGVGGSMIIFLAALQNVPTEMYEAARVDGAGAIRLFRSITLPMMTPILLLQLILGLSAAFQTFNQVQVLTKGGPGTSTNLYMFKIYTDAFGNYTQLGLASAEAWILFLIVLAITAVTLRTSRMWVFEGNER